MKTMLRSCILLMIVCVVLAGTRVDLQAATPSSGTVTTSSATLGFSGGPFDNTNQTGVPPVGPPAPTVSPVCSNPTLPCDDFALTVTVPADTLSYSVHAGIAFTNPAADFDLYVIDADGTTVDAVSANGAGAQESVTFAVPHGTSTYTVRVVPFSVTTGSSGDTYTCGVTLARTEVLDPPDPPDLPTIAGMARFKTYAAPDGLGDGAGEPSLGADWATAKVMFQSGLQTLRVGFDDCSSPAATTWEDKSATNTSQESLDPILFTDSRTNRTFVSQLVAACSASSFTDDDGDSYTPSQGCGVPAGADHQTIGGGPFAPGPNGPLTSYPDSVYYCSQENETSICAMSQNGGLSFGPGVPAWTSLDCGAIHGHIKVASDGTAYVPNRTCGSTAGVIVTENNGLTWTVRPVTGSTAPKNAALVDPSVGIGAQGRVYFGYQGSDGHAWIAVSDDRGATWHDNQDVGAPLGIENTTFPAVVAGDNDRAAFAFLGTLTSGDYGDPASFNALWHLYVAVTYDGGVTWTTTDATPHDPVQRGSICNQGTVTCMHVPDDRNLLDFNDITIDRLGHVLIAFADGCVTSTCVHGSITGHTFNDYTSKASIARQSGGRGLLAQYDPNPVEPVAPRAPRVKGVRGAPGVVQLSWEAPDNGGAPITGYKIYRGTTAGGETLLNTTGARTSYEDITADPATTYFYRITAVNSAGEGAVCGEISVATPVDPGVDPCSGAGLTVSTDASDAAPNVPPAASVNIASLSVSEPYLGPGTSKLVFTLQVGTTTLPTPNSQWYVLWNRPIPDAGFDRDYVAMKTDATGAPSFEYGKISPPNANLPTMQGAADGGSYDAARGIIRITIANDLVDNLAPGQTLTGMQVRTFFGRVNGGPVTQTSSSDYSPEGIYTLVGNAACRPNAAPTAVLQRSPANGCAPLSVQLDGSGSFDPDAGDAIGTYQFDFGDGSPAALQSTPAISHTYGEAGNYAARLHVTDSRGKISQNVDLKSIEVHATPSASASGGGAICSGASTVLHGTGGSICTWSPAAGLSDPASCDPTASPAQTTTYSLTVTTTDGCASTASATVTVTVSPCTVSEVLSLTWSGTTKDTLSWTSVPNATGYRLFRGDAESMPALADATIDSCIRFEGSATSTGPELLEAPSAGTFDWYIVTATNGSTQGPAGNATHAPRVVDASGLCP